MEFKRNGDDTVITAQAFEVADLWVKYLNNPSKRHPQWTDHKRLFEDKKQGRDEDFHGSLSQTHETLVNNNFVLEDFFKNNWSGQLRDDLSFLNAKSKKRKRNLSEHDGDFDFDRVWDVKLFNSTRTEPFDNRVIVDVSFDISCDFTSEDIREYGKLCYHVTNFIEEHGYVCDINLVFETTGMYTGTMNSKNYIANNHNLTKINIKQSSEYQDNITICKYFTDWFYRRCVFNLFLHHGMEQNLTMGWGLGSPKRGVVTTGSQGYILLAPMIKSQIEGKLDFEVIRKAIENAIGENK